MPFYNLSAIKRRRCFYIRLPAYKGLNTFDRRQRGIKSCGKVEFMKNIQEILSDFGLTVPEERAGDFDKVFRENYKSTAPLRKTRG